MSNVRRAVLSSQRRPSAATNRWEVVQSEVDPFTDEQTVSANIYTNIQGAGITSFLMVTVTCTEGDDPVALLGGSAGGRLSFTGSVRYRFDDLTAVSESWPSNGTVLRIPVGVLAEMVDRRRLLLELESTGGGRPRADFNLDRTEETLQKIGCSLPWCTTRDLGQ